MQTMKEYTIKSTVRVYYCQELPQEDQQPKSNYVSKLVNK